MGKTKRQNQTKEGKEKREHGYARKLDIPTKKLFHSFDSCPDCGGELGKPVVAYTRQVIDIPVTPVEVTEHVIYKRWCFTCKKQVKPRIILSHQVLGKQRIGIRLMSIIGILKEVCRQPIAVVQKYLEMIHGLSLSEGELVKLLHKTADKGKPSYSRILKISVPVLVFMPMKREDGKTAETATGGALTPIKLISCSTGKPEAKP